MATETWMTTTGGTVWLLRTEKNKMVPYRVAGKERKVRITTEDRELMEERNPNRNPFSNGMLKRVDEGAKRKAKAENAEDGEEFVQSDQALTDDELTEIFHKKGAGFKAAVKRLNEMNVRRLRDLAEGADATATQMNHLNELVEAMRPGGPTSTYKEMEADGDVAK